MARFREWGVELLNVSAGSPYYDPHIGRPFEKPDEGNYEQSEQPLLGVDRHFRIAGQLQRAFPDLQRRRAERRGRRHPHHGLGRGCLAYPDYAADALEKGELDEARVCKTLTYCTFPMRQRNHPLGQFPTGCPPFDKEVYGPIVKEAREAKRKAGQV